MLSGESALRKALTSWPRARIIRFGRGGAAIVALVPGASVVSCAGGMFGWIFVERAIVRACTQGAGKRWPRLSAQDRCRKMICIKFAGAPCQGNRISSANRAIVATRQEAAIESFA
jgi:hypothetical protein